VFRDEHSCDPHVPVIDLDVLKLKFRDAASRWLSPSRLVAPTVLCEVHPAVIRTSVEYDRFTKYGHAGYVEPGRWDIDAKPLESNPKYRLIRAYHEGAIDPDALTAEHLRERGYPEREANHYAVYGYGHYLDELAESIRARGVDHEHARRTASGRGRYDQIAVNVGRDGDVIFNACGFHRLATARALDVGAIPVRLNVVHEDWIDPDRPLAAQLDEHPSLSYLTRIDVPWADVFDPPAADSFR
jgi:hypothetical protein